MELLYYPFFCPKEIGTAGMPLNGEQIQQIIRGI